MKLVSEPGRSSRRRTPKASEMVQPAEVENEAQFDPERDLGETYGLELLQRAEEYLRQPPPGAPGTEAWPFGAMPEEREPSGSIEYLAAHKLLFPRHQTELDALMQKYHVKEKVLASEEGEVQFLHKMILAPEMKQKFVQQANNIIRSMPAWETGVGMGAELLLTNAPQVLSVKPELFGKLGLRGMKKDFFDLLASRYAEKQWHSLITYAPCARLLFPDDFDSSFLQPNDWEQMRRLAKNSHFPSYAFYLAILAAEQVQFLPEGEVRITLPTSRFKSKPELPPRQHV